MPFFSYIVLSKQDVCMHYVDALSYILEIQPYKTKKSSIPQSVKDFNFLFIIMK